MPSDTAAQSSDAAEPVRERTIGRAAEHSPAGRPTPPDAFDPLPGRPGPHEDQSSLLWTVVTAAAAVLFCAALVFGATRLFIADSAGAVTDTPERTVSAFLGALLGERDAQAAAAWLCTDKADRDLSEAVAAMSAADGDRGFEWRDVTETNRSVGAATVTAEIGIEGSASPATWEFSLVAEEGDPQWLICGIAAG